jgi:hypothetical protein
MDETANGASLPYPDLDEIAKSTCDFMRKHGAYGAQFHLYGTQGGVFVPARTVIQYVGQARHAAARDLGAGIARAGGCGQLQRVVLVAEAYMRFLPEGQYTASGEPRDGLAPSEAPDRIEVLTIAAMTRDSLTPAGWRIEAQFYTMVRERPSDQRSRLLDLGRVAAPQTPGPGAIGNSALLQAIIQGYSAARLPARD